jgi:hypothetical protein
MGKAPLTRAELRRALVVNALAHPANVAVATAVLAAGLILGASWLAIVAAACWVALAGMTFFDEGEAARVGERLRAARRGAEPEVRAHPAALAPDIRRRVRAAAAACESIRATLAASPTPLADVEEEVEALLAAIQMDALRAQRIHEFLGGESVAGLDGPMTEELRAALEARQAALTRLQERLDELLSGMDQIVATLQTVQAEILAHDGIEQRELASQVFELREKAHILSAGLEESFAETRVHGGV